MQQHSLATTAKSQAQVAVFLRDGGDRRKFGQLRQNDAAESAVGDNPSSNNNNDTGGSLIRLIKRHIRSHSAKCVGVGTFLCYVQRQISYAQCAKLLALFAVAVAHLFFLPPFLDVFSRLEKYVNLLDFSSTDSELIRQCVRDLADYKKNVWMTVAVLCVGLSTSCFFLFLLPSSSSPVRKCHIYLIGLIDLVSFGCLPALFLTRMTIMRRVQSELAHALEQAHRLNSAEALMNEIKCTIHPREKLPFCSELILRALITNDLVKFLLVLCALTLAYLAVAYFIYWCIKHWIPHSSISSPLCQPSANFANGKFCHCLTPQLIVAPSDRWKKRRGIIKGAAIGYSPLGGVGSRRSSVSASSTTSVLKVFATPTPPATSAPLNLAMPCRPPVVSMPFEQCSPMASVAVDVPTQKECVPKTPGQNRE